MEKWKKELNKCDMLIKINPVSGFFHLKRAETLENLGFLYFEECKTSYAKALEYYNDPNDLIILIKRAKYYVKMNKSSLAVAEFNYIKSLIIKDNNPNINWIKQTIQELKEMLQQDV